MCLNYCRVWNSADSDQSSRLKASDFGYTQFARVCLSEYLGC